MSALSLNYLLTLGSEINVSKLTLRLKRFRKWSTTLLKLKIINKLIVKYFVYLTENHIMP